MKHLRLAPWCLALALLLSALLTARGDEAKSGWLTNFKQALAAAQAGKKAVLADFTGSDWCGFCIKLKKEVLDTDDFKKLAADKFVLLELDFPKKKAQSDEEKQQNAALARQFKVRGYPTILILDADGKEHGRIVGYSSKADWMDQLKKILAANGG
jgi:protein disulfide-isomerase